VRSVRRLEGKQREKVGLTSIFIWFKYFIDLLMYAV
jgi:hypothetical protein